MKLFNWLLAMAFSAGMGLVMLSTTPAVAVAQEYPAASPDYGYGPSGPIQRFVRLLTERRMI